MHSRTCIQGRFGNYGPCMESPALCEAPLELAVGQTAGSLGDTNTFLSSCNAADRGEAVAHFRAPSAGVYAFRVTQHANEFSLALRNACDPAAAEVAERREAISRDLRRMMAGPAVPASGSAAA